jgi:hypothetical protein
MLYLGQHTWPPIKILYYRCETCFVFVLHVYHIVFTPPSPGNLTEYHDADGWDFQEKLEQNYGRVVRFQGLLGVRK